MTKARGLRKYHERFLKKYHDWEGNNDYRREERSRFGSKRYDLDDDFGSFRNRRYSKRAARSDSDNEEDHIGRRHKSHRKGGDLDDLDQLDRKVEGIEKKLKGSLNQAEGEETPEEPVKEDKKDEKKDEKKDKK